MKWLRRIVNQVLATQGYQVCRTFGAGSVIARYRVKHVLDVGANRGQFAVEVLEKCRDTVVWSFEPIPLVFEELSKLNHKYSPRFSAYQLAFGQTPGFATFNVNDFTPSSSMLEVGQLHKNEFPGAERTTRISVKVETLDLFLATNELSTPALLKIDTQGFELQVLAGATASLSRFDYLIIEISLRHLYEDSPTIDQVYKYLTDRGFTMIEIVELVRSSRNGAILQFDALFQNKSRDEVAVDGI